MSPMSSSGNVMIVFLVVTNNVRPITATGIMDTRTPKRHRVCRSGPSSRSSTTAVEASAILQAFGAFDFGDFGPTIRVTMTFGR